MTLKTTTILAAAYTLAMRTAGSARALSPTLMWTSHPTFANETVLVWGSSLAGITTATISSSSGAGGAGNDVQGRPSTSVPVFDVSPTSFKATLPPSFPAGVFTLCVGSSSSRSSSSNCIDGNAPDLFWKRGDVDLATATAGGGGWVRAFGRFGDRNGLLPAVQLQLTKATAAAAAAAAATAPTSRLTRMLLPAMNATANEIWFAIPAAAEAGSYALALVPGGGDAAYPVNARDDTLIIVAPAAAPPGHVQATGAKASASAAAGAVAAVPSKKTIVCNTTAGIFAALNATALAGGGTILLEKGTYNVGCRSIDLPPGVTLKGVSTAKVSLRWDMETVPIKQVPKYFIGGNGSFSVEDLTIYSTRFYNNIIQDGRLQTAPWTKSDHVRVARVRIRADCFYRLVERGASARRGLSANFTYEQVNAAIYLQGTNAELVDNDIYASGHGIYLQYAQTAIIARNQINYGMDCYMLDSSSNIIFEDNFCQGINLFSRGNAGGATYGGPAASYIFYARNTVKFVFGGDQEMMTLDGGSSPYIGKVAVSSDGLQVTFPKDPKFDQWCNPATGQCQMVGVDWNGSAAYVLKGQGKGQLRVFASGGYKQNRTWTLEQPFGGSSGYVE